MIFGTSRHVSVGTFAITSLMIYSSIIKIEEQLSPIMLTTASIANKTFENGSNSSLAYESAAIDEQQLMLKVKIATSLAFWSGAFQVKLFFFLNIKQIKYFIHLRSFFRYSK